MCGIVGVYQYKNFSPQKKFIQSCLVTMHQRGPDAKGFWEDDGPYSTGFVRLAIRDLSANGNQPMLSECGGFCITYNGELYNTAYLKQLLLPFRNTYLSGADTEVLLYALIHLGVEKTLQIADGIFAFAFYNANIKELVLARDRVGVKPLYVGMGEDGIVFSSQYNHIIQHPYIQQNGFEESAVTAYLNLGYMPEGNGVISGTGMMPHGCYYSIKPHGLVATTYYTYGVQQVKKGEEFESVLSNSVNEQLISDVPVGTFMSGGVDSTLVSYFANQQQQIRSYTIGVDDLLMDESVEASKFAELFKTDHHVQHFAEADLLPLIQTGIQAFSEPFADYSSLPALMLSKFARRDVTVALSGDGGDELFWGYPRNRKALSLIPYYQQTLWGRRSSLLTAKLKHRSSVELARHWSQSDFVNYYHTTLFIAGAVKWVPRICKASAKDSYFLTQSSQLQTEMPNDVNSLMQLVRKLEVDIHLQRILQKVDRTSMYNSLEVRVPFLSNAMLDYSLTCDYKDCIKGDVGKQNVKQALIKRSSSEMVLKPKKGFVIPMETWMRNGLKREITEKLMDMPIELKAMFNASSIEKLLQQHINNSQNNSWVIWALYSFIMWHNNWHQKK